MENGFEVLLATYMSVRMSTVTFRVNMCYFVGHVSCLGILGVILKNNKLDILWFLSHIKECRRTAKRLHLTSENNLI